jgi:fructose-bisphosphate aldolase class I
MNTSEPLPDLCSVQTMSATLVKNDQLQRMTADDGFVAALDQSGGSTPKALAAYGIKEGSWAGDAQMYGLVHQMRSRIITSPSFTGRRVLGAILFENTMDREIEGSPTADYLWDVKRVVPFLKVDEGLAQERNGVQLMKPMPRLAELLAKANAKNIFGTKMRSFIKQADQSGIEEIVNQQFGMAAQILAAGLVPIIEPEVDIHCPEKAKAEDLLKDALLKRLEEVPAGQVVFLKLTLPDRDDAYMDCIEHRAVARVLALSGGYSREQADDRLRRNHAIIASFSRALLDGLTAQQSQADFDAHLDAAIQNIYDASTNKITSPSS